MCFHLRKHKKYSFKRMNDVGINNYYQYEGDEVEPKRSKIKQKKKIFGHDFLIYLLENEPQTYSEA